MQSSAVFAWQYRATAASFEGKTTQLRSPRNGELGSEMVRTDFFHKISLESANLVLKSSISDHFLPQISHNLEPLHNVLKKHSPVNSHSVEFPFHSAKQLDTHLSSIKGKTNSKRGSFPLFSLLFPENPSFLLDLNIINFNFNNKRIS